MVLEMHAIRNVYGIIARFLPYVCVHMHGMHNKRETMDGIVLNVHDWMVRVYRKCSMAHCPSLYAGLPLF